MPTPTLVSVEEMPGRTGGAAIGQGNVTGDEVKKYRVIFDGPDVSANIAKNVEGVPAYFSRLDDTALTLLQKHADQEADAPNAWIVTCNYSIPQPGQNDKANEDSEKWNIKISSSAVPWEIETKTDWSGKKIATSAGEPFTGQKLILYDERLVISYDTYTPDGDNIRDLCGMVNDDTITLTIYGQEREFILGSMKYDHFEMSETRDKDGAKATSVTLQFLIRSNLFHSLGGENYYPWRLLMDDIGTYYKKDSGVVPFPDANNNPLKYGNYLNGHGYPLGTNETGGTTGTTITAVQRVEFDVFKRVDLTPLFEDIEN